MSEITFEDAIEAVLGGNRITRKEWKDKRTYGLLKDGLLQIHKAGEKVDKAHPWILNDGDMMADDWIIL